PEGEQMRIKLSVFVLIITSALAIAAQVATHNVEGNWLATLKVGGAYLRVALHIKKAGDNYAATFDSLDQGATDLPIDSLVLSGNKLSFSAAKFGINYEG